MPSSVLFVIFCKQKQKWLFSHGKACAASSSAATAACHIILSLMSTVTGDFVYVAVCTFVVVVIIVIVTGLEIVSNNMHI